MKDEEIKKLSNALALEKSINRIMEDHIKWQDIRAEGMKRQLHETHIMTVLWMLVASAFTALGLLLWGKYFG